MARCVKRDPGEQALGPLAEAQVDLGHHPDRGALIDGEVGDPLGQFGDELDGGGAGADDGDPAALESDSSSSQAVVWMTLPAKSVMPGMSGTLGWDRKPVAVIRKRAVSVVAVGHA